jgi:spore maturation protein CgeB
MTSYRILLLNTDYDEFLRSLYRSRPLLAFRSYERQLAARNASLFGTADFMSVHLRALGHEAVDVHVNNRPLQEAWMATRSGALAAAQSALRRKPVVMGPHEARFYDILETQIRVFQPNIIYNHDIVAIPAGRLDSMKPRGCRLVAQIAAPLADSIEWDRYDLVISSLPNYVAAFRQRGVRAAYCPLAFETRVLDNLDLGKRDLPFTFVGSVFPAHGDRRALLEKVARDSEIEIWGQGVDSLPPDSAVRRCYRGMAWGGAMYEILGRSRVSLNKHIDISESYANNMRLFEATGVGALLLTDWKENLGELFEPGREVVAYRSAEECIDLARHYLAHDSDRERIAAAGAARCRREHSYAKRMSELVSLLDAHFG